MIRKPIGWALAAAALALGAPTPALAGWRLVEPAKAAKVAKDKIVVTPAAAWNRQTVRPTKRSEVWTRDGMGLNELAFFAAIPKGEPLFKEVDKKNNPLPKFDPAMLPPELVQFFETSARTAFGSPLIEITQVRPATLGGHAGVHFAYRYTIGSDNVERLGEARAAIVGGKLYLVSFEAPKIHYFDAGIEEARTLMDSAQILG